MGKKIMGGGGTKSYLYLKKKGGCHRVEASSTTRESVVNAY